MFWTVWEWCKWRWWCELWLDPMHKWAVFSVDNPGTRLGSIWTGYSSLFEGVVDNIQCYSWQYVEVVDLCEVSCCQILKLVHAYENPPGQILQSGAFSPLIWSTDWAIWNEILVRFKICSVYFHSNMICCMLHLPLVMSCIYKHLCIICPMPQLC